MDVVRGAEWVSFSDGAAARRRSVPERRRLLPRWPRPGRVEEPLQLLLAQLERIGLVSRCRGRPCGAGVLAGGIELPLRVGAGPHLPGPAVAIDELPVCHLRRSTDNTD